MAIDLKTYIGLQVRSARKRKGLTQEQLAERIDRATETISNIERGCTWTGLETLQALSRTLDHPIPFFFPADNIRLSRSKDLRELDLELDLIASKMAREDLEQLIRMAKAMKPEKAAR